LGGVNGNRPGRWWSGRGVWCLVCGLSGERCGWDVGSGGRIRTSDLWVMSPTSCHCSTPRQRTGAARQIRVRTGNGGRPQRPRLPTRRRVSTLRRCRGSRPGSGWDRVGPRRSRPRAPRIPRTHTDSLVLLAPRTRRLRHHRAHHEDHFPSHTDQHRAREHTPLTIRTPRLQSVTGCPPGAYQPGRLPGVSRTRRPWDVSSRGKIPA
jgi:hypothetical protein